MKHFCFDNTKDIFFITCLPLNVFFADSVEWNSKNYKSCCGVPTENWEKQIEEKQHRKSIWLMPYTHFTGSIWYERSGNKEGLGTTSVGGPHVSACVYSSSFIHNVLEKWTRVTSLLSGVGSKQSIQILRACLVKWDKGLLFYRRFTPINSVTE